MFTDSSFMVKQLMALISAVFSHKGDTLESVSAIKLFLPGKL